MHMGRDRHCESPPGVVVEEDEEEGLIEIKGSTITIVDANKLRSMKN